MNSIQAGDFPSNCYAQNLAYQYDGAGNVTQITDSTVSPAEVINYTYDELDRVKTATGAAAPYNYGEIGRMTQNGDFGTLQYTYGDPAHVHAVKSAAGYTYSYDANGNMTEARGYPYGYDAENRLVSSPMSWYGSTSYTYDGQGNMVKRRYDYFGQYQSVVYVGGLYEKTWNQGFPSSGGTKYYWAFGRRIAMRSGSSGPSTPGTVSYFLADNLGSTNSVLHSSGAVMQDLRYRPYGWIRRSSGYNPPDKRFTGQQWEIADPSLNMYNYGARFYSTVLGRFLSPDPLVVSPGDPQMLDRYAYVRNNPLRYVGPTGLSPEVDWEGLRRWRDQLLSFGVPEQDIVSTMLKTAQLHQALLSPTVPTYYLTSTYKGDLLDYPLFQAEVASATSVTLRVALAPETGQLVIIYEVEDDAPLGASLRVTMASSNGGEVEASIDPVASLLYRIRGNPQRDTVRAGPCIPPCGPGTRVLVYDCDVGRAGGVPTRVRIEPVSEFTNWRRFWPSIDLGLTPVWY